jgi:hypothetical protein
MLTFKNFQTKKLSEAFRAPSGEKVVKTFKVGKKNYEAVVTQKGRLFVAYIDGDQLDVFKTAKEAEAAAKEFTDLMGK